MTTTHETSDDDEFGFHPKPHTLLRLRLAEAGFSPIPLGGKIPTMPGWQNRHDANADEIMLWQSMGWWRYHTDTGLITRNTPGIDIDISDEDAADAIEDIARDRFGDRGRILVRTGRAPRRAIMLRTNEPFAKIEIKFETPSGEKQAIEILADGQQTAAFGIHPDTEMPYTWRGGEPGDIRADELPLVTGEDMLAFRDEARELLIGQFGYRVESGRKPTSGNGKPRTGNRSGAKGPAYLRGDIDRVRKALKAIPNNNVSRDEWINIGLATAGATGCSEEGLAAWEEWSRKAPAYPNEDGCPKAWAGFQPDRIGMGTLVMMAEAAVGVRWEFDLFNGDGQGDAEEPQDGPKNTAADNNATFPAKSLEEVHSVFERYLGKEYDMATLDAVLAVTAAEKLGGDPGWLLVISGPGNAKTETVQSIGAVPDTHIISTIASEGALLSATTPKKGQVKNATGGLLRKIGDRGILVIKDVTSILSMDRNVRGAVLAALREIHDGRWERNVGTDGGRTLSWEGRIVVIGACTTAWDQAHGVISSMGDRFVTIRSSSRTGRLAAGAHAIRNAGIEAVMRKEMAEAVAGVIDHVDAGQDYALADDEIDDILHAANIVTLARTSVETDYRGEIVVAHEPEMPTRFAKQLSAVIRGGMAVGMPRDHARALAMRCAKDSVPQLRLDVLKDLEANGESRVVDIRRRLQQPRTTIDRTLQALHALKLLICREEEQQRGLKFVQVRYYQLASSIAMDLRRLIANRNRKSE